MFLWCDAHCDKCPVFAPLHTWHSSVQLNRINCILFFNFTLIEWAHYPLNFQTYIPYLSSKQLQGLYLSSLQAPLSSVSAAAQIQSGNVTVIMTLQAPVCALSLIYVKLMVYFLLQVFVNIHQDYSSLMKFTSPYVFSLLNDPRGTTQKCSL